MLLFTQRRYNIIDAFELGTDGRAHTTKLTLNTKKMPPERVSLGKRENHQTVGGDEQNNTEHSFIYIGSCRPGATSRSQHVLRSFRCAMTAYWNPVLPFNVVRGICVRVHVAYVVNGDAEWN